MNHDAQTPQSDQSRQDQGPLTAPLNKSWLIKMGVIMPLLRAALTGTTQGPDVFAIAEVLGKEKTISRMLQMAARK